MNPLILILLLSLSVVQSCRRNPSTQEILNEETFAAVYVALAEDGAAFRGQKANAGKTFDAKPTLSRLGVTREQCERTIIYYHEDIQRWKEFYAEIVARQEVKSRKPAIPSPLTPQPVQ